MIRRSVAYLALALLLLTTAACGQEAPPRAARATATPLLRPTHTPEPQTLPTLAVATIPLPSSASVAGVASTPAVAETSPPEQAQPDPRSLGDPKAPITVIEYSDFQ